MSKNRLLQIVNRLKLTSKDKNDLVNIIESEKQTINFGELEGYEYYETIINLPSGVSYNDYTTYESLGEEGQKLKESFKKANKSLNVMIVDKRDNLIQRANNINHNPYGIYPYKISWIDVDARTSSVYVINDILDNKFYISNRFLMFQE